MDIYTFSIKTGTTYRAARYTNSYENAENSKELQETALKDELFGVSDASGSGPSPGPKPGPSPTKPPTPSPPAPSPSPGPGPGPGPTKPPTPSPPAPGPSPPTPPTPGGYKGALFGWWIYNYGCVCTNQNPAPKTAPGYPPLAIPPAKQKDLDPYTDCPMTQFVALTCPNSTPNGKGADITRYLTAYGSGTENTNFFLGNGGVNYYPGSKVGGGACGDQKGGAWCINVNYQGGYMGTIKTQMSKFKNNIINFGGWGDCGGGEGGACHPITYCNHQPSDDKAYSSEVINMFKWDVSKTTCPLVGAKNVKNWQCGQGSTQNQCQGPNEVWSDDAIAGLPTADMVKAAGFTGISLDIEGVVNDKNALWYNRTKGTSKGPGTNNLTVDTLRTYLKSFREKSLTTIITTTGNPLDIRWGGMSWFTGSESDARLTGKNKDDKFIPGKSLQSGVDFDYLCVMFYNHINDTELYCTTGYDKVCNATSQPQSGTGGPCSVSGKDLPGDDFIANVIKNRWTGVYNVKPEHIIAGLSFGTTDGLDKVIPTLKDVAKGGISVWAKSGGCFNWGTDQSNCCPQP